MQGTQTEEKSYYGLLWPYYLLTTRDTWQGRFPPTVICAVNLAFLLACEGSINEFVLQVQCTILGTQMYYLWQRVFFPFIYLFIYLFISLLYWFVKIGNVSGSIRHDLLGRIYFFFLLLLQQELRFSLIGPFTEVANNQESIEQLLNLLAFARESDIVQRDGQ